MAKEKRKKKNFIKSLNHKTKLFFRDSFWSNKIVIWLLSLNILANAINWIIIFIFLHSVDRNIILHYNVYFGVDKTGSWKQIFILSSIGLFVFITNLFLAIYFYKNKERIASYILLLASFMVQISLMIASLSIIIINY